MIVPFLQKGLVQQTGWLNEQQFLVAVAMGMLSPAPVVITATFVGYLVAGLWGVHRVHHRDLFAILSHGSRCRPDPDPPSENLNVQGFVKGAYAAAIGTMLGAGILLSKIAIGDWLTVLIGLASLVALARWKVNNAVLVAITPIIGLAGFELLKPTSVFVR